MIPLLPKLVKRCDRCELQYPIGKLQCPHCRDLTDAELVDFLQRRDEELKEIAGLGRVFIVLAVVLFFSITISLYLSK